MVSIDFPLSRLLDEIQSIILERHKKYSAANIAGAPGGPFNGLRVRLYDKLARLNNAVENGVVDYDDDSFRDCWVDVVGYGLIGLLVLDGDWPGTDKPVDLPSLIDRAVDQVKVDEWWNSLPHKTRWSELYHGGDEESARHDKWRVGTTFEPSDVWASLTWTRGVDGWSAFGEGEDDRFKRPNLPSVVRRNGYTDGTIIEPRQNTRDEAA